MTEQLIQELGAVEYVCTTADIWSKNNKSFFGVTAHWIDRTLQRRSAALACRRIKGRHTFDIIASTLESIHNEYRISQKVVMTVTDNGSNFVKAFKEFSGDVVPQSDDASDDHDADAEDVQFVDINALLDEDDGEFSLPPHQRCASHTLNLVAVSDSKAADSDAGYKRISRATLGKCSALWNKAGRSTPCADIVRDKINTCLTVPCPTRWNSFYNSVDKVRLMIEKNPHETVLDIFKALDVSPFKPIEITFLTEYCSVMHPLALALDLLQAETKCFMGRLLPTLTCLLDKLKSIRPTLKLAAPLVDAVHTGIVSRFGSYFDRSDLILSSVTTPAFHLRWLNSDEKRERARSLLYAEVRKFRNHMQHEMNQLSEHSGCETENDEKMFYDFGAPSTTDENAQSEVDLFLADPSQAIETLQRYELIKAVYVRYNTPLPSSAPVERLFSMGGKILTPGRNKLTDENFERLLLLRANKWISAASRQTAAP